MITDGIDRLRGEKLQPSRLGRGFGPGYRSMPTISLDATSASETSQRCNVIVYSPDAVGVGRARRSSWDLQLGLSRKYIGDPCYLVFLAVPKAKAGFQRVDVQTKVANSEIPVPDDVWVPAAGN